MRFRDAMKLIFIVTCVLMAFSIWARPTTEPIEEEEHEVVIPSKYNEAPMLAALVAKGELPPVEERLPDEPMVMETVSEIGKYGGQLRTFNNDMTPRGMWGSSLFRVPRSGIGNAPNLAAGYEVSDDKTTITVFLRPGTKWSDGHPFTSEDIRFMYDDMHNIEPAGQVYTWHATGRILETKVIDEYTIELICPAGVGSTPQALSNWNGTQTNAYTAAHYLKQWHILYNTDAEKVAKEEGYDTWFECFNAHSVWFGQNMDLDLPKMTPWYPVEQTSTSELHERNPYYWAVDEAGNQLPYIDSAIVQIVDPEVYQLKVSGGEADLAWSGLTFDNIPLYMSNSEANNYSVALHPGNLGNEVALCPANDYYDEAERDIWRDMRVRQAISVAVDREDINEALYMGYGVPRQCSPLPSTSYYKEEWGEYYAQYDPALANKLLDEAGLDKKDSDGYRLRPDGKVLSIVLQYNWAPDLPTLELVKEYWEAVGLKTTIKQLDEGLYEERMFNNELQVYVKYRKQPPASDRAIFEGVWVWASLPGSARWWGYWLEDLGNYLRGDEPISSLPPEWRLEKVPASVSAGFRGAEPDEGYKQAQVDGDHFANTEMGSPEYIRLAQKILDYYIFNLMHIGFVGMIPSPMIVHNRIGNGFPPGWVAGFGVGDNQYVSQWTDRLYVK